MGIDARTDRLAAMAVSMVALLSAGCSGTQGADAGAPAKPEHVVQGSVSYRDRMALPLDAEVEVRLVDITMPPSAGAAVPPPVIADTKIVTQGRQVPIPFELHYEPSRIQADHRYAVRAAIRSQGETMFSTSADQLVITQGRPSRVELWLERGSSASGASNAEALIGTSWRLTQLGGQALPADVECTLDFAEAGKIAGKAACNRFFATVTFAGTSMSSSPLGSTRMACPGELMTYERDYLAALQAVHQFALEGDVLVVHTSATAAPLRFTRNQP